MNFTCVKYKNAVRVIKSQKYIEIVKDFRYLSFLPKNQEKIEKNAKSKKFLLLKLFSIVFITIGTIKLSH